MTIFHWKWTFHRSCKMSVKWLIKIASFGRLGNLNLTFILFIRSKTVSITEALFRRKHQHKIYRARWHWLFLITTIRLQCTSTAHDDFSNECMNNLMAGIIMIINFWKLLAQSTAQGHLRAFQNTIQNMHIIQTYTT